jgi:hypothetical protein
LLARKYLRLYNRPLSQKAEALINKILQLFIIADLISCFFSITAVSRGRIVHVTTGYWLGGPVSVLGKGNSFSSSLERPEFLRDSAPFGL